MILAVLVEMIKKQEVARRAHQAIVYYMDKIEF